PLHLHQIVHHGAGLFCVTGSVIENISVWRIAPEQAGASERTEKQHLALKSVGQCHGCRGCPHIADDCKNLVFLIEPLHCFGRSNRLVTVICRNEPKHAAMNTTARIGCVERSLNAQLHILTELLGRTAECRGNSKPNFVVGYAAKGSLDAARFLPEWLSNR